MRPKLLVLAASEAGARAALAAGADLAAVAGAGVAHGPDGRSVPLAFVASPADGDGEAVPLLDPGARAFFDAFSYREAERFASACRASRGDFGFCGLEGADVPRLLPLRPAILGFDALGPEGIGAVLALLEPAPRRAAGESPPDRVFVRDLVLELEIGAYGAEHGRRQRVRVSMEVDIAPPQAAPAGLAEIYSYDRMLDAARSLAARGHTELVETLAEALAADLLRDERVEAVMVRIEKLDLGTFSAGVEIRRRRG